jgi:hypothetical protein
MKNCLVTKVCPVVDSPRENVGSGDVAPTQVLHFLKHLQFVRPECAPMPHCVLAYHALADRTSADFFGKPPAWLRLVHVLTAIYCLHACTASLEDPVL